MDQHESKINYLEGIVLKGAGKVKPLHMEVTRTLGPEDVELMAQPAGSELPLLKRLRHNHHMAARLLAEGRSNTEVALLTGYAAITVTNLQSDPMFKELVAYYQAQVEVKYLDVHERLASLGMDAVAEIHDRLDNEPDSFTLKDLREVAELALDRSVTQGARPTGSGPANQITVNFVNPAAAAPTPANPGPVIEGTAENLEIVDS